MSDEACWGDRAVAALSKLDDHFKFLEEGIFTARQMEAFAMNAPWPVWCKRVVPGTRSFRMLWVNPAYRKLWPWVDRIGYVGELDTNVWPPEIAERFYRNDLDALANGIKVCVEPVPDVIEFLTDPPSVKKASHFRIAHQSDYPVLKIHAAHTKADDVIGSIISEDMVRQIWGLRAEHGHR